MYLQCLKQFIKMSKLVARFMNVWKKQYNVNILAPQKHGKRYWGQRQYKVGTCVWNLINNCYWIYNITSDIIWPFLTYTNNILPWSKLLSLDLKSWLVFFFAISFFAMKTNKKLNKIVYKINNIYQIYVEPF